MEGVEEALTEKRGDALRHGLGEESGFGGSGDGRRASASFGAAAIGGGLEEEESFKGERRLSSLTVGAPMVLGSVLLTGVDCEIEK